MEIRNAILAAANHIEANPHLYQFMSFDVPEDGQCGCMFSFTGKFAGLPVGTNNVAVQELLGIKLGHGAYEILGEILGSKNFVISASDAAKTLRLFADKYHPAKAHPAHAQLAGHGRSADRPG